MLKTLLFFPILAMMMSLPATASVDAFQHELSAYQSTNVLNGTFLIQNTHNLHFAQQIGFADIALRKAFTKDLQFPIASISKQFTACAILLLKEDKRLTLHDSIINYLGANHPIWQGKIPQWAYVVTIHQLLTHSSGIPSYTNETISDISEIPDKDVVPYIISFIKEKPLNFTPGEKFEYNNTGFLLLSVIIEALSDEKSASQFFNNRIFKPLNMQKSFLPDITAERQFIRNINKNELFPKRYIANLCDLKTPVQLVTEIHLEMPLLGAGGMISTLEDLLKWNEALYHGKILSAESLALMTSIQTKGNHPFFGPVNYGYGLYINNTDAQNVIYYHGGWIQGVRAQLSFSPKNDASVAYFSNVSPDESQSDEAQHVQVKGFSELGLRLQKIAMN